VDGARFLAWDDIVSASVRLAVYLNDHLAGATLGVELARRAARSNRGTDFGTVLSELADELAADRRSLESVIDLLGISKDRGKIVLAWGAEKVGRLKLNGRLIGYSPLSRLEELELLVLGIDGKLLLWRTLAEADRAEGRLAPVDLPALIRRAQAQRRRVERQRLKAARDALT
jgi:hypothetical protein